LSQRALDVVFLIGRILFGVLFVISGYGHFAAGEAMQAAARQAGAPAPATTVPLTGAVIIVSGLAVIFGVLADLGALLITGFLFLTAFIIHAFWKLDDPQMRQMEQIHFFKDLGLAGAALTLFYAYNQLQGEAGLSITDPLFGRG
jgi:putative oxidoreductase